MHVLYILNTIVYSVYIINIHMYANTHIYILFKIFIVYIKYCYDILGGGRFHMLPGSYTFSHGLCLNNFFQFWFIGNQIYEAPLFRYINRSNGVSHFVRGRKLIGYIKYLMRSVKRAAEAVGIWTEDHWDVKRVN